jgi:type I restriction enzyme S subunit
MVSRLGHKKTDLGVIPGNWEFTRLGDIATISDGTHQTPKYVPNGIPFYSVEHVTSGDFKNTKFISEKEHQFLTRFSKIEKGNILMTRIGSIGDCKLIDWDVNASFYVSLALLKIDKNNDPSYIVQYSNSSFFKKEVELNSLQSAIPKKINLGPISNVRVLLPPLLEQQAISEVLSDVDELIDSLDALIDKKCNLKQATMQQLLTRETRLPGFNGDWNEKELRDIASVSKGSQLKIEDIDRSGQFPHLNGGISPSNYTNKFNTARDTVAISEGGNSCGYVQLMNVPYWCGGHCYSVIAKRVDNKFLYHILKSKQSEIMGLRVGSGLPNVQKSALLAFKIEFPLDIKEQIAIAEILSDIDADLNVLEIHHNKAKILKQGMMQELFTGRTRLI